MLRSAARITAATTRAELRSWIAVGEARRDTGLVRRGAGREVVGRRDRVADVPDQGDVVLPDADAAEDNVATAAATTRIAPPRRTAASRRVSSAQTRISPGWSLTIAPRRRPPHRQRPVEPAPADREEQEQQRADLAELQRIGDRPRQAGEQERRPADRGADGQEGDPATSMAIDARDPEPRRGGGRHKGEREDGEDERRRVIEEAEAAGLLDGRVVEALAGEDAARRLVVGEEVEPERSRRTGPRGSRAPG